MTERFEFDHLSVGVRNALASARLIRRELGAEPLTGGVLPQFRYLLLHLGEVSDQSVRGGRLELISPASPSHERPGFMDRFLDRHGESAHHLSFNVPDLPTVRSALHDAGFPTAQEDLEFPDWQEIFLPPDSVHGVLIQVASSPHPIRTEKLFGTRNRDWSALPNNRGATDPGWWEELWETPVPSNPKDGSRAALGPVVLGTSDLDRSETLFREILRGDIAPTPWAGWRSSGPRARKYVWPTGSIVLVEGEPGVRGAVITAPRDGWLPKLERIGNVHLSSDLENLMTEHDRSSMPSAQTVEESTPAYVRREDRLPHVAHVVIDRPEARNAINADVAGQLGAEFERCDQDPDVRVIVLSGARQTDGREMFSAGLDLKAFAASGDVGEIPDRGFAGITEKPPATPIIAAVEGFALAGGFEIALACDLIVAAEDARIGLPEPTRGLVADGGALIRLPERIPVALAMEFALTGAEMPVAMLERFGVVNRIVPAGEAVSSAHDLAAAIARNAPLALAATKQVLARSSRAVGAGAAGAKAWEEQRRIAEPVWISDDAREGAAAFAEKRDPVFRGE